jgi:hypothetical protein
MAGLPPYAADREGFSFTLKDPDGAWTFLALKSGFFEAEDWMKMPPTWHFDIKTTRGPLDRGFVVSPEDFEKVRSTLQ